MRLIRKSCAPLIVSSAAMILGVVAALPVVNSAQTKSGAYPVTIRENGDFRAELGFFFVENGRLDVYDGALESGLIWDNVLRQHLPLHDLEKELSQKAAPYYHERYELQHGSWQRISREFTQQPTRYLDFAPCDARDQLDLPDDPVVGLTAGLRRALPRGVKIKDVADLSGNFIAVVASEPPNKLPSIYEPGVYALHVLILSGNGPGWKILENVTAGHEAYFCGMRHFQTKLRDQRSGEVLLLYSSVPEGSRIASVMRQVQSFLIQENSTGPRAGAVPR